jgi:hypothetical protein
MTPNAAAIEDATTMSTVRQDVRDGATVSVVGVVMVSLLMSSPAQVRTGGDASRVLDVDVTPGGTDSLRWHYPDQVRGSAG